MGVGRKWPHREGKGASQLLKVQIHSGSSWPPQQLVTHFYGEDLKTKPRFFGTSSEVSRI